MNWGEEMRPLERESEKTITLTLTEKQASMLATYIQASSRFRKREIAVSHEMELPRSAEWWGQADCELNKLRVKLDILLKEGQAREKREAANGTAKAAHAITAPEPQRLVSNQKHSGSNGIDSSAFQHHENDTERRL